MVAAIRICLVGAGRVGAVHGRNLVGHVTSAKLAAVVDPDSEARASAAEQFGIPNPYSSLDEALAHAEFEAVVITTPTFTHASLSVQAAGAGKHIFLEKPMALDLHECDAIIQAAEAAGVHLQLGFMRRFDPDFAAAKARIDAGEIGRPMLIKSLTHGPGLPPPWARALETSNGNLAEVNSHDWDCTRWLMGADPERVYVETANFKGAARGVSDPAFYDTVLVNIRFAGGGLGSISGVCPCDYGYDARVELVGEMGLMQIGDMQGGSIVAVNDRDAGLRTPIYRTWPDRFAWAYIREMQHFVDSIRADTRPKVGGEDGRWAVAGVLAGIRSYQETRVVTLAEVFDSEPGHTRNA